MDPPPAKTAETTSRKEAPKIAGKRIFSKRKEPDTVTETTTTDTTTTEQPKPQRVRPREVPTVRDISNAEILSQPMEVEEKSQEERDREQRATKAKEASTKRKYSDSEGEERTREPDGSGGDKA